MRYPNSWKGSFRDLVYYEWGTAAKYYSTFTIFTVFCSKTGNIKSGQKLESRGSKHFMGLLSLQKLLNFWNLSQFVVILNRL